MSKWIEKLSLSLGSIPLRVKCVWRERERERDRERQRETETETERHRQREID